MVQSQQFAYIVYESIGEITHNVSARSATLEAPTERMNLIPQIVETIVRAQEIEIEAVIFNDPVHRPQAERQRQRFLNGVRGAAIRFVAIFDRAG